MTRFYPLGYNVLMKLNPFEKCKVYKKIWHKNEKRFIVVIRKKDGVLTSMSYARYLMCLKEGRWLKKDEDVDHINGKKDDDRIENLQILSKKENIKKYRNLDKPILKLMYVCPVCNKKFERSKSASYKSIHLGKIIHCSRKCAHKNKQSGFININKKKQDIVDRIKEMKNENKSSYVIAKTLNISRNTVMKYW